MTELTTHPGHFLGRGISRRDIGSWDPLPPHLAIPYRLGGHRAQVAFWGGNGNPDQSVFHQLSRRASEPL